MLETPEQHQFCSQWTTMGSLFWSHSLSNIYGQTCHPGEHEWREVKKALLVPPSSYHSGNHWLQARFVKVKIAEVRTAVKSSLQKILERVQEIRRWFGRGQTETAWTVQLHLSTERFDHISLVTLLKPCILFWASNFQITAVQTYLVLLITFYLVPFWEAMAHQCHPQQTSCVALLDSGRCASLVLTYMTLYQHPPL